MNLLTAFYGFEFQRFPVDQLQQMICPDFKPSPPIAHSQKASTEEIESRVAGCQQNFLHAAARPLSSPSAMPLYRKRWQIQLNDKARSHAAGEYSKRNVNLRFALLAHIAINYHIGGPRYYPFGHGNTDNSNAPVMSLDDRLRDIALILRGNKRVVMDVVEGTNVIAFVQDPNGHHSRVEQAARDQEVAFRGETAPRK